MEISLLFLFFAAGQAEMGTAWRYGDFVVTIRAELPASVEKSGVWGSSTNVVLKPAAEQFRFSHPHHGTVEA
jgi:hypothetical protein